MCHLHGVSKNRNLEISKGTYFVLQAQITLIPWEFKITQLSILPHTQVLKAKFVQPVKARFFIRIFCHASSPKLLFCEEDSDQGTLLEKRFAPQLYFQAEYTCRFF